MRTASVQPIRSVLDLPVATRVARTPRWLAILAELLVGAELIVVIFDSDLKAPGIAIGLLVAAALTVLAVGLTAIGVPAVAGVGMLVAGIVGVACGAGLGVPRLYVGDLSPEAAIGLLALVAGAALLVVGAYRLVVAIPGWWRLVALPLGFLVFQFALLPPMYAVFGTHTPRSTVHLAPPAGANAVSFLTDDGVSLAAWYTPSKNRAAIVVLHGAGGTKADTRAQADVLVRHGYGVLALDASGGGASGGSPMAWGWQGNRDVAAAVSYLLTRPDVDPQRIGALGESMGGEQAITAAAADPRIRAVVAEGASVRVPADIEFLPTDPGGRVQRIYYALMWGIADLLTEASPPIPLREAVRDMTQPLLLITSDDPNDQGAAPLLSRDAPASFRRWDPPNTGHTQALATHPEEWEQRVTSFFDAALPG